MFRDRNDRGFTLIELLVVIAVIAILTALAVPTVTRGLDAGRAAACISNLRQMSAAYLMYIDDHDGRFFNFRETTPEGVLYYFGLDGGGGREGEREIDKSRAKLAEYFSQIGRVEVCPSLPYDAPYFKRKYEIASYGYGLNAYLFADRPAPVADARRAVTFHAVSRPSETVMWGDAIQINTWQAPASARNPMLEEWYYLGGPTPNAHFRHRRRFNAVMADGSHRTFDPSSLNSRCDGLCGRIEDSALWTVK